MPLKKHFSRGMVIVLAAFGALTFGGARLAHGADLTRAYLNAHAGNCALSTAHINALRRYQVLLVPGYFADYEPAYFADAMRWLASMGVAHQKVAIASRQSVGTNSAIIAKAIHQAAQPVLLITHSKGSVDTLDALLSETALRTKVHGWISLQGAFFGSPIADKLLDGSAINPLFATLILGFFGGTRESAHGLSTDASRQYYRERAAAIRQLLRDVPALALASAVDAKPDTAANTSLALPYEWMAREGIRNDGLIPMDAAVLPDMDFIRLSGVDHIAPVMAAQKPFDRLRMLRALLLTLRAPAQQSTPRHAQQRKLFDGRPSNAGC